MYGMIRLINALIKYTQNIKSHGAIFAILAPQKTNKKNKQTKTNRKTTLLSGAKGHTMPPTLFKLNNYNSFEDRIPVDL